MRFVFKFNNVVISCIPSSYYSGNSRAVVGTYPGIYRKLFPGRPGTYAGLMRGSRPIKICLGLKKVVTMVPRVMGTDLPRDLQKNVHCSILSRGCTLDVTKYKIKSLANIFNFNKGDPRTCGIFILGWASNWGLLGFPVIKITMVRQVRMTKLCIYCSLSIKINA